VEFYENKMRDMITRQGNKCPVCDKPIYIGTYHHQMHNTKGNRQNFPLSIDSRWNGMCVHQECIGKDNKFKRTDLEMRDYEFMLEVVKSFIQRHEIQWIDLEGDIKDLWEAIG